MDLKYCAGKSSLYCRRYFSGSLHYIKRRRRRRRRRKKKKKTLQLFLHHKPIHK
jgi:hypothetical protein